ncbi:MAG: aminotransferase class V-fold PLP-dependent enzyme [Candidatus Heimdallarchaeota archaeon]|nr:aminotransferase class V-fold PLP-dependent enzyme [Candidatus Heimdallarchaeota archaeon]
MFSLESYREYFPQLRNGLIFLDSATSSLIPSVSINKMTDFYHQFGGAVPVGVHSFAEEADHQLKLARKRISKLLGASSQNLAFTSGLSYNLSIILHGLNFQKGERILTSLQEQHSVLLPLLQLKKQLGVAIDFIEDDDQEEITTETIGDKVTPTTRLVVLSHASLLNGQLRDIPSLTKIVHQRGALLFIDASHSLMRTPLKFSEWDLDFLSCCSSLGFMAPTGIGFLLVRKELGDQFSPLLVGNHSAREVSRETFSPASYPLGLEPDLMDIGKLVALLSSLSLLEEMKLTRIMQNERQLGKIIKEELLGHSKITLYEPPSDHRVGIYSFNVEGMNALDLSYILNESEKIIVRGGSLCAIPLMDLLGVDGVARASLSPINDQQDITTFTQTLELIAQELA